MQVLIDHEAMKRNNQLRILNTIREKGAMSRIALQKETKLGWGTITSSVKELLEKQVLVETGSVDTNLGRKPVNIDLNEARNLTLGLRLGTNQVKTALLNVKGKRILSHAVDINPDSTKAKILEWIYQVINETLKKAVIKQDLVAGVGIAAPGAVDNTTGTCLYAPRHPNWKNVHLREKVETALNFKAFVDHVNNCSALGERWFGAGQGKSNFISVLIGSGLGAGIIIDNQIYRGPDFAAGELGHICIDPRGPLCVCGKRGCLENYASGRAVAAKAKQLSSSPEGYEAAEMPIRGYGSESAEEIVKTAGGDPNNITAKVVHEAAKNGDETAKALFNELGEYLGLGISTLINLFDPEYVILDGGIAQASEFFLADLERVVKEHAWAYAKTKIVISELWDAAEVGAAALVLEEIYRRGLLLS